MRLEEFARRATPSAEARAAAERAVLDTVGVTLAGVIEPSAQIVRRVAVAPSGGPSRVFGTSFTAPPAEAALANGTAAHALDYDDMCFVSLAHPSAPLLAAAF